MRLNELVGSAVALSPTYRLDRLTMKRVFSRIPVSKYEFGNIHLKKKYSGYARLSCYGFPKLNRRRKI